MKSTGIVRDLDQLGMVVIPKELRTTLDIKEGDPIEVFVDRPDIILRKFENSCIFCGSESDFVLFEGRKICRECLIKIKKKIVVTGKIVLTVFNG